ncbi:MAG: hydroxyacid dehydrogenase [Ruminococcaceae bacterium]|nr:hydroxyacid dehydrogenase [Oscillospiraceae bacterium]
MKAIFMTKGGAKAISNVYTAATCEALSETLEFVEPLYSLDDLNARADELNEVEIAFSTWGMFPLTGEQIAKYFGKLKAVFYGAGTVQYFARPFLEAGISVHSAWAANAVPVAEYTVAQIILANKGYFQRFHRSCNETWINKSAKYDFTGNYKNKVGLIGIGMIGSLVAEMLKAYNFEVLAFDPFLPKEKADALNLKMVSLEELFSECTVISNHLANNPQTVGMLNGKLFDRMMPNACFINTGRGAQVVEDDLIAALEAEPYRVALLDVTLPEPPVPESKLYRLDNVFLSPHIAGSLGDEIQRMGEYMLEEYRRFAKVEPCKWQVSMKMLETMA